MKIDFITSEFKKSHGCIPRGTGSWLFAICGEDEWDFDNMDNWLSSPALTLTAAKSWLRGQVVERIADGRIPKGVNIDAHIMP